MTEQATQQAVVPKNKVVAYIQERKNALVNRLPKGIDPERFYLGIMTAIQKSATNSKPGQSLADCDPNSVLLAAYDAAEIGCSLSPALAHGWLINYGGQAQFQPSYRFFIQKAYETKEVKHFYAECVYAGDKFERQFAPKRNLFHAPGADNERSRKTVIGAYALVEFSDGEIDFEYLTTEQIERHRNVSKNQNSMKWVQFYEEGFRITPIRVIAKRLPLKNRDLENLVEMVNRDTERDLTVPVDDISTIEPSIPRQIARAPQSLPEDVEPEDREPQQPQQRAANPTPTTTPGPTQQQEPKKNGNDKPTQPTGTMFAGDEADPFLSPEEIQDFWNKTFQAQWKKNQTVAFLKENFKVDGPKDLRKSQLPAVLSAIIEAHE